MIFRVITKLTVTVGDSDTEPPAPPPCHPVLIQAQIAPSVTPIYAHANCTFASHSPF